MTGHNNRYRTIERRVEIVEDSHKLVTIVMPALMTTKEVAKRLCVSIRTVWRMMARGELPQPKRFNRKLVRWRTEDIDNYIRTL